MTPNLPSTVDLDLARARGTLLTAPWHRSELPSLQKLFGRVMC